MASRLLEVLLFEISRADPLTIVAAAFCMLIVVSAAYAVPALRATNVDPGAALRSE